jgi:hypothetical protein
VRSTGASEPAANVRLRARSAISLSTVEPPVRRFLAAAACFLLAALAVAVLRATAPFDHGWWLVAYLALVGGLAQALLGTGAPPAASADRVRPVAADLARWQLGLWNTGTVAVATFDVLGAPGGVLAGSVALLAALVLFARDAAGKRGPAHGPTPDRRTALFLLLIAFLAISVVVGCYLAYALPGR